jgi:chemotaxis protein MotD
MTPSLGQALTGLVSTNAASKSAAPAAKNEDASFGDLLRGAEKQSAQENQQPAETGPHDVRWNRRAFANPGKAQPDGNATTRTAAPKPPVGKAVENDADTDADKASTDAEPGARDANASPLQDSLPLLMALNDIGRFQASAKAGGHEDAGDGQTNEPALDGQPPASRQLLSALKKSDATSGPEAHDPGAFSRSERASNAEDFPGKLRQPEAISAVFKDLPRRDDGAAALPQDQAPTDVSAAPAKRPGPSSKTLDAIRSATPAEQAKQSSSAARIDVVAEQSFPAPAQNPLSQTASALIDALASDKGLPQAFSTASAASQPATSVAVPTHILKIELHPAELGMVTASLRLSGEQLSIELKPETHEAHRRLAADSEAITKSLRDLGFDVDKVTILQPSIATTATARADAGSSMPMSAGREQPSFQPGGSSGNNAGSGGQQPGRNPSNDTPDPGRGASPARERAGDGMFI